MIYQSFSLLNLTTKSNKSFLKSTDIISFKLEGPSSACYFWILLALIILKQTLLLTPLWIRIKLRFFDFKILTSSWIEKKWVLFSLTYKSILNNMFFCLHSFRHFLIWFGVNVIYFWTFPYKKQTEYVYKSIIVHNIYLVLFS